MKALKCKTLGASVMYIVYSKYNIHIYEVQPLGLMSVMGMSPAHAAQQAGGGMAGTGSMRQIGVSPRQGM